MVEYESRFLLQVSDRNKTSSLIEDNGIIVLARNWFLVSWLETSLLWIIIIVVTKPVE